MLPMEYLHPQIVMILTFGFALASLLGYASHYMKMSPILGYLLAGYLIGPYSPGFVADLKISEQLAEIGVILMMFGVGLHFAWKDLIAVRHIAIPGATVQTLTAATAGALLVYAYGWAWQAGVVIGLGIGVASTVVLIRVLSEHKFIDTTHGHAAVGWLIVEDIFTVVVLLILPVLATSLNGQEIAVHSVVLSIVVVLLKFLILIFLTFTFGRKIVKFILAKTVSSRSSELFTLTILALTFVVAAGSSFIFGTSIVLGSFLAGMIIGQTDVRRRVIANSTPLKDVFSVIFFLAVGMLFNPVTIFDNFFLFLGILSIVLIVKPAAAFLIVFLLRQPARTGLIVSVALAQIGEFSFILAEEGSRLNILPDAGYDVIVAAAFISISFNPLLFKMLVGKPREGDIIKSKA